MLLPSSTYELIKGEVANVYRQYNICNFPICATQLAKKMGFEVVAYSSLDSTAYEEAISVSLDGFYAERDWKEYIFINDSNEIGRERKRMTIFHEIGHPVLGHDDFTPDDEVKESEAKFFGKYLAAPSPAVHLYTLGMCNDRLHRDRADCRNVFYSSPWNWRWHSSWRQSSPLCRRLSQRERPRRRWPIAPSARRGVRPP